MMAAHINTEKTVSSSHYILAVDVGTTCIKSQIFNDKAEICGETEQFVQLEYPKLGYVEIDPDALWDSFVKSIMKVSTNSGIPISEISCMGLSVHRGTFITWDRLTNKPFHKFIVWNDLRADRDVKKWNNSFALRSLRFSSKLLHKITRLKRLLSASIYKLSNNMVLSKLYWVLQNNNKLRTSALSGNAMFGTLDTWLIYKLTGNTKHVSEYSCASSTGIFDPYVMEWGDWCLKLFDIPESILPKLINSSGDICDTDPAIFGSSIKISSVLGDQQAAMFGQGCFDKGDVKLSLGTGTFLGVNTGDHPHASLNGLHPLVAWKIGNKTTYMVEGMCCDTGTIINWAQNIGLFNDPAETNDIANSVIDSHGVYFVPAFSGIQAPVNDARAGAGFVGISQSTTKVHMVRAILESVSFRAKQMYECIAEEVDYDLSCIRVDGGVSNNSFIMQLIADLTLTTLEKPECKQLSCLGVAFMAGVSQGIWSDYNEMKKLSKNEKVYEPNDTWAKYRYIFYNWERAIRRLGRWYKNGVR
ncbi:putative glycerol kinase 5 [Nymphon striatum]|nr:putative glycerol kinase 5 [Nymphon striatum]